MKRGLRHVGKLALGLSVVALQAFEEESVCKKIYSQWYHGSALATENVWQNLKGAISEGKVAVDVIQQGGGKPVGIFLYRQFEENGKKFVFMHPSPQWMQSPLLIKLLHDKDVYTVGLKNEADLILMGAQTDVAMPDCVKDYILIPDWENAELFELYKFEAGNKIVQAKAAELLFKTAKRWQGK